MVLDLFCRLSGLSYWFHSRTSIILLPSISEQLNTSLILPPSQVHIWNNTHAWTHTYTHMHTVQNYICHMDLGWQLCQSEPQRRRAWHCGIESSLWRHSTDRREKEMGEIGERVAQSKQLDRKHEKDELVWVAYQNQLPSCCNLPQTGLVEDRNTHTWIQKTSWRFSKLQSMNQTPGQSTKEQWSQWQMHGRYMRAHTHLYMQLVVKWAVSLSQTGKISLQNQLETSESTIYAESWGPILLLSTDV